MMEYIATLSYFVEQGGRLVGEAGGEAGIGGIVAPTEF